MLLCHALGYGPCRLLLVEPSGKALRQGQCVYLDQTNHFLWRFRGAEMGDLQHQYINIVYRDTRDIKYIIGINWISII